MPLLTTQEPSVREPPLPKGRTMKCSPNTPFKSGIKRNVIPNFSLSFDPTNLSKEDFLELALRAQDLLEILVKPKNTKDEELENFDEATKRSYAVLNWQKSLSRTSSHTYRIFFECQSVDSMIEKELGDTEKATAKPPTSEIPKFEWLQIADRDAYFQLIDFEDAKFKQAGTPSSSKTKNRKAVQDAGNDEESKKPKHDEDDGYWICQRVIQENRNGRTPKKNAPRNANGQLICGTRNYRRSNCVKCNSDGRNNVSKLPLLLPEDDEYYEDPEDYEMPEC